MALGRAVFNYIIFTNIKYYMWNKLVNYIKGSVEEMKKVTWPTKKETKNYTLLVIGISIGVAAFLGALDVIFIWGLEFIVKK